MHSLMKLFPALALGVACLFAPEAQAAHGGAAAGAAGLLAASVDEPDASAKVDLNRAGIAELVTLPGIGETVAERIVRYREENGPFRELRELMNVRGIGEKTYLKLESRLTLSKPEPGKTGEE